MFPWVIRTLIIQKWTNRNYLQSRFTKWKGYIFQASVHCPLSPMHHAYLSNLSSLGLQCRVDSSSFPKLAFVNSHLQTLTLRFFLNFLIFLRWDQNKFFLVPSQVNLRIETYMFMVLASNEVNNMWFLHYITYFI